MNFKTILKVIVGIIVTIVLGAIGSGVWERILSPALDWIYRFSVGLISKVSIDYKNNIYEAAEMGFHEDFSFRLFLITTLLLSLALLLYVNSKFGKLPLILKNIINENSSISLMAKIIGLSFVLFTMYTTSRHEAVHNIKSYSLVSMDVLRPYVGEDGYVQLKSDYLQIRTAEEFYRFNEAIIKYSKKHIVKLPKFEPI